MTGTDITSIVEDSHAGDTRAADQLLEAVYTELRGLAAAKLAGERSDHPFQPTALVHEAYLRLVNVDRISWEGRTHFRIAAAGAMKRILIDEARKRDRQKRGGGKWQRMTLDDAFSLGANDRLDALALQEALEKMQELDVRVVRIVELRLLGGLSVAEVAEALGVSERTVHRDWNFGQAWLRRALDGDT